MNPSTSCEKETGILMAILIFAGHVVMFLLSALVLGYGLMKLCEFLERMQIALHARYSRLSMRSSKIVIMAILCVAPILLCLGIMCFM